MWLHLQSTEHNPDIILKLRFFKIKLGSIKSFSWRLDDLYTNLADPQLIWCDEDLKVISLRLIAKATKLQSIFQRHKTKIVYKIFFFWENIKLILNRSQTIQMCVACMWFLVWIAIASTLKKQEDHCLSELRSIAPPFNLLGKIIQYITTRGTQVIVSIRGRLIGTQVIQPSQ